MFRMTAATVLLPASATPPLRADDVTPALKSGAWYADGRAFVMGTRYEYTFRKDGTFKVEILNDVPNPPATGTWKVAARGASRSWYSTRRGAATTSCRPSPRCASTGRRTYWSAARRMVPRWC